jgi:hypothetical protein
MDAGSDRHDPYPACLRGSEPEPRIPGVLDFEDLLEHITLAEGYNLADCMPVAAAVRFAT